MNGRKKGYVLSEGDRKTLEAFLSCSVPRRYYELDARGNERFDFSYNYEEVYDYADALLHGQEIKLWRNFNGTRSLAVNEEFRNILPVLARRDGTLTDFCEKFERALDVILRAAR